MSNAQLSLRSPLEREVLPVAQGKIAGRLVGLGLLVPLAAAAVPAPANDAPVEIIGSRSPDSILTIRPKSTSATRQGLRQFVGVSGANSGARGLSLNEVIIPPGGRATPHRHIGTESAIYIVSGRVRTHYGRCLEKSVENRSGDFLFIPPDLPHMPENLSRSEPALAIVARNDANEQEQVEVLSLEGPAALSPPGAGRSSGQAAAPCPPAPPAR